MGSSGVLTCWWLTCILHADSQKQYWAVKKYYRDVILFFKVGKFYELYEDDAQIGADVLHWRMTITGVGHCRQVQTGAMPSCSYRLAMMLRAFAHNGQLIRVAAKRRGLLMAQVGCPESGIEEAVARLTAAGYKVCASDAYMATPNGNLPF